jgi:hypothetical protein
VKAVGIGAARGQVMGDSLDRSQIGRPLIKTQFSSYSAHKFLTGMAVGECSEVVKIANSVAQRRQGAVAVGGSFFTSSQGLSRLLQENKSMLSCQSVNLGLEGIYG